MLRRWQGNRGVDVNMHVPQSTWIADAPPLEAASGNMQQHTISHNRAALFAKYEPWRIVQHD